MKDAVFSLGDLVTFESRTIVIILMSAAPSRVDSIKEHVRILHPSMFTFPAHQARWPAGDLIENIHNRALP
jgi:hypothetical protein